MTPPRPGGGGRVGRLQTPTAFTKAWPANMVPAVVAAVGQPEEGPLLVLRSLLIRADSRAVRTALDHSPVCQGSGPRGLTSSFACLDRLVRLSWSLHVSSH